MGKQRLLSALKREDEWSQCIALIGLDRYPGDDTASEVIAFMERAAKPLKQIAAVTLGRLGPKGKARLEEILAGDDEDLIEYALLGYEFVQEPNRDLVERHLWSGNTSVVQAAALTFGKLWPNEVIETLGPLFGHVHDGVRCHTLPYVFVDTEEPDAINHLTFVYRRAGSHLREHIIDAIRRGMRKNPELMLKTVSIPATLLAEERQETKGELEELSAMLNSGSELERWRAAHEIVTKPIDGVRPLLKKMLTSRDPIVVRRALAYILDHDPNYFLSQLFELLNCQLPEVRVRVAAGLVRIDIPEEMLLHLLGER